MKPFLSFSRAFVFIMSATSALAYSSGTYSNSSTVSTPTNSTSFKLHNTTSSLTASSTSWTTSTKHHSSTTPSHTTSTKSSSTKKHTTNTTTTSSQHHHTTTTTTIITQSIAPTESQEIFHPTGVPHHPLGPWAIHSGQGNLPQQQTNGRSPLGTFNAPKYNPFISQGSQLTDGFPWGPRRANNTNPYTQAPRTGVTRQYNFVLSRDTIAPDGVERSVILVNDQFPGPTIEANWGDTIEVTVVNNLQNEGTAIHWHGLLQTGTPYEDGIPGITQCPIAPGTTFTYSFNADLYGTSWWHAHYSAQYAGGLFGAMIIHGPSNAEYDVDLGPFLLSDYYHEDYYTIVEEIMGTDPTKFAPYSVNNLINGKGIFNCSLVPDPSTCTPNAGLSKLQFTPGTSYRLRLINAGAEAIQKFSIDDHELTVMAYDFVPIQPYTTDIVTLGVGQRADVIVTAKTVPSASGAYWMRSTICSCSLASQPNALAMIYYPKANTNSVPDSTAWPNPDSCANDPLTDAVPFFSIEPTANPSTTETIDIGFLVNQTGHFQWTMNNSSFRVDYNDPILNLANEGNDSYPYNPDWNVYNFGSNSSIRLIINNLTPAAHPMHMHGHNFYVLSAGTGSWDGSIVNPSNPARRDVQLVEANGYIVIQIDADNPGVWPFHCHIAWHVSGGLYVNIMERPADIANIEIPSSVIGLCNSWSTWTANDVVDQIDSGLRR